MENKNNELLLLIQNKLENKNAKFLPEEFVEIIYEISKIDKELVDNIKNVLFVYNNKFYKKNKDIKLDEDSYNLGMFDLFNEIVNFQFNFLNKIDYEKEINSLKEKQRQILDIIYYNDGIDSNYIKKKLNITSQYLYNLTNETRFLKLVIINKNYRTKKVFYSLTLECRTFLDKLINKNIVSEDIQENILNKKFRKTQIIDYKEEGYGLRKNNFKYNA